MVSSISSEAHSEEGDSLRRRVRGITKGKNSARMVKHSKAKLPFQINEEFNSIVGENASKVANALGVQVRTKAPVEGVSLWSDIDQTIKDSIIQGMLDLFDMEGGVTDIKIDVLDAKCNHLYNSWKCRAKTYYNTLLEKGENPYTHCYAGMQESKWKYMIENVWNTEKFKKRSEINKQNRDKLSSIHTMGSKSFASALYETTNTVGEDQVQPKFSEFLKKTHYNEKKGGWIDPRFEEDHAELVRLENESLVSEEEPISAVELSRAEFGKSYYLKGLGPSIKAPSKTKLSGASTSKDNEIKALNTELETLRNISHDYEGRLDAQEATIKAQETMIGSLNKTVEDMKTEQVTFMKMVMAGTMTTPNNTNFI